MMKYFRSLTLQNKLLMTTSASLIFGALITAWTLITINNIDKTIGFVGIAEEESRDVLEAGNGTTRLILADLSYILTGDERFAVERAYEKERLDRFIAELEALVDLETLLPEETERVNEDLVSFEQELAVYNELWREAEIAVDAEDIKNAKDIGLELDNRALTMFDYTEDISDVFAGYAEGEILIARSQIIVTSAVGLVAIIAFIALSSSAAYIARNQLDKPINTLLDLTATLEQGNYDTSTLADLTNRSDEIGFLARAFERMASEVSEREESLKDTIEQNQRTLTNLEA